MSKTLQRSLKKNIPNGTNGSEWDSSDEEDDAPVAVSKQQTKTKVQKSSKGKKIIKYDGGKQGEEGENEQEKGLVLYIGHLPKDFEEIDLRRFISQFGKVYNCRVARKIETGQTKGYAFVRFGDDETAKIVCETLHGYFLEKQRLDCRLRPSHPGMFFDTAKIIKKRKNERELEVKQRNRNLANSEKLKAITSRLVNREMKKRERLEAIGVDYDFPGYKTNRADFEEEFIAEEEDQQTKVKDEENDGGAKKKRRKEAMDSTNSRESPTKKNKKERKKRNSVDSVASSSSKKDEDEAHDTTPKKNKKERKKNSKKR